MFFWALLGILTSGIYPIIYYKVSNIFLVPYIPQFYPMTVVRNCLLLGFIVSMLISRSCLCNERYLKIWTHRNNLSSKNACKSRKDGVCFHPVSNLGLAYSARPG